MLRIIISLLFDGLFIKILISEWDGLGGYKFLILAIVAFFTWELIRAVKYILNK